MQLNNNNNNSSIKQLVAVFVQDAVWPWSLMQCGFAQYPVP